VQAPRPGVSVQDSWCLLPIEPQPVFQYGQSGLDQSAAACELSIVVL
jgi:hypothetical protein